MKMSKAPILKAAMGYGLKKGLETDISL